METQVTYQTLRETWQMEDDLGSKLRTKKNENIEKLSNLMWGGFSAIYSGAALLIGINSSDYGTMRREIFLQYELSKSSELTEKIYDAAIQSVNQISAPEQIAGFLGFGFAGALAAIAYYSLKKS
jgi:hypothetical protein